MNEQRASLEVGVVPNYGHLASTDGIARVADAAEELGFDSVWVTDHLLVDEEVADPYGTVFEPMNCLAWLASRLEGVRLGTSIVLLPLRHPVHLAKEAATVQQHSGGRLRLGIGVGWHEPEFHFLGYDFSDRGRRADESLRLMRALWEGRREFGGEYWSFEDAHFDPLPEIWVAGNSSHSLRRARELGDAWHPLALGPEDVRQAKQSWSEGRNVPRYELRLGEEAERSSSSMRKIGGSPAEVADQIGELAQAGVDGVVLSAGLDPETAVRALREFSREVAPRLAERGHQG